MKKSFSLFLLLSTTFLFSGKIFAQVTITEKDLIGNWVITGGSGEEFDKEMIDEVLTFSKEHKAQRMEEGEMLEADWKLENNVITITSYYNDGINDPEMEILTVIQYDGKKWTAHYTDEDDTKFTISLERAKTP